MGPGVSVGERKEAGVRDPWNKRKNGQRQTYKSIFLFKRS